MTESNQEIVTWIDKDIVQINSTKLFRKYFSLIPCETIESSRYLTSSLFGLGLVLTMTDTITSIHFFSGNETMNEFRDKLPFDLKFANNKNDINSLLGIPNRVGGDHSSIYLGYVLPWEKYYF